MTARLIIILAASCMQAAELRVLPEFLRTGPDGVVTTADRTASGKPLPRVYAGARAGYVSLQLIASLAKPGEYTIDVTPVPGLQVDLFREWYHKLQRNQTWYPDALVPAASPYRSRLPEPDNQIASQSAQAFWIDVWIPADAKPGEYPLRATLRSAEGTAEISVPIRVLAARVPDEDVVAMDHNSYGSSWIGDLYAKERARTGNDFFRSDTFFKLIHAHHRIFYEHRGLFHQLGYGHGGKVGPEFAPAIEGTGRRKHITSWDLYDRHYGPLFDGTAFAGSRRGARPIPYAYLPVNPEWPASYLWWGEPGYEAEFVNVVSEMEKHFREKNWTRTKLELFFNHKKRYMGFAWDGDEVRFEEDNRYFKEYGRLMKKAVGDTPVPFVFRSDSSWSLESQSKELAGIVNMWICSGGIMSWYPEVIRGMKKRGDVVFHYSGPPRVTEVAAKITEFPLQTWLWGIDGFVHWLTVSAGSDPWFAFEGGGTALVYSGERFGIAGPIPGIRLKIQRNAVQDLALLDSFKTHRPIEELRAEAARRFNGSRLEDWWNARPAVADKPPSEWSNSELDAATSKTDGMLRKTTPDAWNGVHQFVMELAGEAK